MVGVRSWAEVDTNRSKRGDLSEKELAAHTGLEPVISALRGQRVNQLHQCAAADWNYRRGLGSSQGDVLNTPDGSRGIVQIQPTPQ